MTKLPVPTNLPQWVMDLKHIPGAFSAIARLVGSLGSAGAAWVDVGTAKGEAHAGRIRADTEARSVVMQAAARAAAEKVGKDPLLADRAVDYLLNDTIRKQENREAVAGFAADAIAQSADQVSSVEGPADDWMNVFSAFAERASSDTLRQHWAQILVGEIRKPGSISLQTLQFMSIIDQPAAELILFIAPYVTNRCIVCTNDLMTTEKYGRILELEGLGFLSSNMVKWTVSLGSDGVLVLPFKRQALIIEGRPSEQVTVDALVLTSPGRQLLQTIDYEDNIEAIKNAAEIFKKKPVKRARYGRCTSIEGRVRALPEVELWQREA